LLPISAQMQSRARAHSEMGGFIFVESGVGTNGRAEASRPAISAATDSAHTTATMTQRFRGDR